MVITIMKSWAMRKPSRKCLLELKARRRSSRTSKKSTNTSETTSTSNCRSMVPNFESTISHSTQQTKHICLKTKEQAAWPFANATTVSAMAFPASACSWPCPWNTTSLISWRHTPLASSGGKSWWCGSWCRSRFHSSSNRPFKGMRTIALRKPRTQKGLQASQTFARPCRFQSMTSNDCPRPKTWPLTISSCARWPPVWTPFSKKKAIKTPISTWLCPPTSGLSSMKPKKK